MTHAVADLFFGRGDHLFHQGDTVRGAFSLTAGLVALERVNEDGEIVIIKLLQPGALFPCADLFASDGTHGTGARAITPVAACFIPLDRLHGALADSHIRDALLRSGSNEARQDEGIIFRLCSGDLSDRIMAVLNELAAGVPEAPDGSRSLTLPLSWRDVAAMVGTSPEVLSRTLRKMTDQGVLHSAGRRVTLPPAHPVQNRGEEEGALCQSGIAG